MAAYLLTWNPKRWTWADLPEVTKKLADGVPVQRRWSCGNNRSIEVGSRVFLLRQGVEPKGIVASGWTTRPPFPEQHWNPDRAATGDAAYYIEFAADAVINPDAAPPLDVRTFRSGPLSEVFWDTPASGNSLPDAAALALSEAWSAHLGSAGFSLGSGDPELAVVEGIARVSARSAMQSSSTHAHLVRMVDYAVRFPDAGSTSRPSMAKLERVLHTCIISSH